MCVPVLHITVCAPACVTYTSRCVEMLFRLPCLLCNPSYHSIVVACLRRLLGQMPNSLSWTEACNAGAIVTSVMFIYD
jgi:hypothetical protein